MSVRQFLGSAVAAVILLGPASASDCSKTSTGLVPLNDPFFGSYQGMTGGLYPARSNHRPPAHEAAGLQLAAEVRPRDAYGAPDEANGKIVFLSTGMSNATQEFSMFKQIADKAPQKNPKVVIVDGAQGGWTADRIVLQGDQYWATVSQRLAAAGVTPAQVQAGWLKEALAGPSWPFPEDAQRLEGYMKSLVRILRTRFPNLKLLYVSNRIYAGYASSALNPEPYAYQSSFSVKWLIEAQLEGDPELSYAGGQAPWLSWGPYLWADGLRQRDDGLTWACSDLQTSDGTHPSDPGRRKVADLLLDFMKSDTTTRPWFARPPAQQPPAPSPAAIVNAPDYVARLASGAIGSIYGAELASTVGVAVGMPLPATLGGAVVRIGGEAASLYYASPTQINFVMPRNPAGEDLVIDREGVVSDPVKLPVVLVAPAIFTMDCRTDGPAAAVHQDGRLVTTQTPAVPDEAITVYLTGLGARNPALMMPIVLPMVRVGDLVAELVNSGPSGFSPGLDLIAFKVPKGAPSGEAGLVIQIGSEASNQARLEVGGAQ